MSIDIHHIIAFHVVFVGCKVRVAMRVGVRMTFRNGVGIDLTVPVACNLCLHQSTCHMKMRARRNPQARRNKRLKRNRDDHKKC